MYAGSLGFFDGLAVSFMRFCCITMLGFTFSLEVGMLRRLLGLAVERARVDWAPFKVAVIESLEEWPL
jgi:hypothetical protein